MSGGPAPISSALEPTAPSATGWRTAEPPGARELARLALSAPVRLGGERGRLALGVRRELGARLRGTLLGGAWVFLAPLASFALYWFLFARLLGVRLPDLPESLSSAMGVWIFTGALVWSAFAEGLARAARALEEGAGLIVHLGFPCELLPLQPVLASLALLVPGLGVFALVCLCTPLWPAPGASWLLVPVLVVLQALFTAGLAWIAATAQVFLEDTAQGLPLALAVLALLTPVFWVPSVDALPALGPWLGWIELNPLHSLLVAWRWALLGGEPGALFAGGPWPHVARFAAWAAGAFLLGQLVFQAQARHFADEV
jgi:lipopolysaccharide transport system permease protein